MGYKELNTQTNERYEERLELVVERLEEISRSDELEKDFADYFRVVSEYLLLQSRIAGMAMDGSLQKMSEAEGKSLTTSYIHNLQRKIMKQAMLILHILSRCLDRSTDSILQLF